MSAPATSPYADRAARGSGAWPSGTWTWPITGPITSHYRQRWGRLHAGTGFSPPIGDSVYAASNGTVLAAGYTSWVKLAHAARITTVYGRISDWTVTGQAGQAASRTPTAVPKEARPDHSCTGRPARAGRAVFSVAVYAAPRAAL